MHCAIRYRKAFTLVELLVVVAIIALLAAILFPVFATAREKARQATCASNLKQIGLGIIQYTQDYDETMPFGGFSTYQQSNQAQANACFSQWVGTNSQLYCSYSASNNLSALWMDYIYPYLHSTGVFYCPSHFDKNAGIYSCGLGASDPGNNFGYAYNPNVLVQPLARGNGCPASANCTFLSSTCSWNNGYVPTGLLLPKVTIPSQIVSIVDRGCYVRELITFGGYSDPTFQTGSVDPYGGTTPSWRHDSFSNMLYVDGHVKAGTWSGYSALNTLFGQNGM